MTRSYKVSRLSLAFILTVASLMLLLGVQMYLEVRSIRAGIERGQLENGRLEVAEAIAGVDRDIKARALRMAHWDEARQQLANPEYYSMWRDARIRANGLMTHSTNSVGLYNLKGEMLAPDKEHDALPSRLPLSPPGYLARKATDHDDLQYFFPIYADPDRQVLMGYGGFSFDILDAIKGIREFSYADPASFSLTLPNQMATNLVSLTRQLHFQPRPMHSLDQLLVAFQSALIRLAVFGLSILLLAALLIQQIMVRPLRQISQELKLLRESQRFNPEFTHQSKLIQIEELENVRNSLLDYQNRVAKLKNDLEESNKLLFEQAHHDALSGAYNRRAFDSDSQSLAHDHGLGRFALLLFDCDHFKDINDKYGHAVGDAVISAIALCLQQALRAEDRLYRLGGDEFAALLLNTSAEQADAIVKRCQEQINKYDFKQYGLTAPIVMSIGVALADPDMSFNETLRHADIAMYRAKESSDRKVVFYEPGLDTARLEPD
jgi:diguanylate cyclase (GGDEF)-like protein